MVKFILVFLLWSVSGLQALETRYSLTVVNQGEKGIYLNWEWDKQEAVVIKRRASGSTFKTFARVQGDVSYYYDTIATIGVEYDYFVEYTRYGRTKFKSNTVFNIIRSNEKTPIPIAYEFPLSSVRSINPAIGVYKKGRPLFAWMVNKVDGVIHGFIRDEKVFTIATDYHDIGEKGGVLVPFILWDFDNDGTSELVSRTGKIGTDSTYITIFDVRTLERKGEVPFPDVIDWSHNQVHYMAIAYLDGYDKQPQVIVQSGVHKVCRYTAYNVSKDLKLTQRWEIIDDEEHLWGGAAHGIYPADVDQDGDDEILFGATCIEKDGSIKWFCGQKGRKDGKNGWIIGHVDVVSMGDILLDQPGLEVMFLVEGGMAARKAPGVYVASALTGEIIWSDLIGHADIGWIVNLTDDYVGLEVGAWSKKDRVWRIYTPYGDLIFSEAAEAKKYQHPILWNSVDVAEVIVRKGTDKDLCAFVDEEFVVVEKNFFKPYSLPRRYAKGDILGDAREELILSQGNTAYIMVNTKPLSFAVKSSRQNMNYREWLAMNGASYAIYPLWVGGN